MSPEIATSINVHVPFPLSRITCMCDLLLGMVVIVIIANWLLTKHVANYYYYYIERPAEL